VRTYVPIPELLDSDTSIGLISRLSSIMPLVNDVIQTMAVFLGSVMPYSNFEFLIGVSSSVAFIVRHFVKTEINSNQTVYKYIYVIFILDIKSR